METPTNPWQVQSIDEFLFYCCPECDTKVKDSKDFVIHALVRHEDARGSLLMQNEASMIDHKENAKSSDCDLVISKTEIVKVKTNEKSKEVEVVDIENEEPNGSQNSANNDEDEIVILDSTQNVCDNSKVKGEACENFDIEFEDVKSENIKVEDVKIEGQIEGLKPSNESEVVNIEKPIESPTERNKNLKTHFLFHCKKCKKSFISEENLDEHLKVKHKERRFHCEKCGKKFKEIDELRLVGSGRKNTKPQFHCVLCLEKFTTEMKLKHPVSSVRKKKRKTEETETRCSPHEKRALPSTPD